MPALISRISERGGSRLLVMTRQRDVKVFLWRLLYEWRSGRATFCMFMSYPFRIRSGELYMEYDVPKILLLLSPEQVRKIFRQ